MPSRLTALWHYLEFLPGVYPVTNALTLSIYYYNNVILLIALFCYLDTLSLLTYFLSYMFLSHAPLHNLLCLFWKYVDLYTVAPLLYLMVFNAISMGWGTGISEAILQFFCLLGKMSLICITQNQIIYNCCKLCSCIFSTVSLPMVVQCGIWPWMPAKPFSR